MYAVGTVVAGKYRVERVLGEGGMGIVLAASHLHLGISVALKVLHHDATDEERVERFMREARLCAQLRSENVCRVMDVSLLDNGMPYIVMEMLLGSDLQAMLDNEGPLPAATACDCVMQACLALAEAHAAGLVHRDLKPANLFWTQRPDGTRLIKVLDFGVAKALKATNSLTMSTHLVGSPGYMSPEQLRSSKDVDARTDIWALGVVLYQLVTGRLPFLADSITELLQRVEREPMPPIVGLGPLEGVIARCLEKDPDKRFANVGEVASALASFVGSNGREMATAVKRVLAGGSTVVVHTTQVPSPPTTLRGASAVLTGKGSSKSWLVSAGVAVLAIALGGGLVIATMKPGDEARPAAAPLEQVPSPSSAELSMPTTLPATADVATPPVPPATAEPAPPAAPPAAEAAAVVPSGSAATPPPDPTTAGSATEAGSASTPAVASATKTSTKATPTRTTVKRDRGGKSAQPTKRTTSGKTKTTGSTKSTTSGKTTTPTTTIEEVSESRR